MGNPNCRFIVKCFRFLQRNKLNCSCGAKLTGNAFDPLPLPSGVPVLMCFCGDPCKVAKFDEHDTYRQRYWMCSNFEFEPTLRQRRINKLTPPPLYDFEQWIDTEINPEDKKEIEDMLRCAERKEMMEKSLRDGAAEKEHKEDEERRRVAVDREDREKKFEHARRAKAAIQENPDALRKGKWPRCTQ
ncbi:hypothetical protein SEVIR_2G222901v4 [Setaria viridis]